MDRIKLLTFTIIALLLLNLATLAFLFTGRGNQHDGRPRRPQPREIIIDKLHFDVAQQQQYEKLIHLHRSQIDGIDNQIRSTKNELYLQLIKPAVDVKTKDSLINELAGLQKQIEATHFKHFQDIKSICKPEQLDKYNNLTEELSRIFLKPPKPPL